MAVGALLLYPLTIWVALELRSESITNDFYLGAMKDADTWLWAAENGWVDALFTRDFSSGDIANIVRESNCKCLGIIAAARHLGVDRGITSVCFMDDLPKAELDALKEYERIGAQPKEPTQPKEGEDA